MGKWPDFEYHVGKWLKYDRSGYPWGPPWTLETLGDLWRPLATMSENGNFDHFQAWSPMVANGLGL